ncbi:hypothetical protein GcM1_250016 [Golovinomyces cichoracearum]|uniref:NADH-ubiquinone oxidoreductase chain 4L n=1 Tax=Golovinomyces cichoracearum TaxID=62708 RepID=A0A420IAJ8_9PEZI|nr:hypothetical protein GcM1_250016 [Golovinomyces cichoracearum]
MLLAITFLILVSSLSFDDVLGQTFAIYIIAIAGAESAIGLDVILANRNLRGILSPLGGGEILYLLAGLLTKGVLFLKGFALAAAEQPLKGGGIAAFLRTNFKDKKYQAPRLGISLLKTGVVLPSFPPLLLVVVAATEDPGLAVACGGA